MNLHFSSDKQEAEPAPPTRPVRAYVTPTIAMSSRSFRRLQRDDPFAITITGEEEGDISDDDDISTWRHGGAADNPFITLSGDDPHQPDEEEDEGNDGDDGNDRTSSVPRQSVKKKKKKKKKQKRIVVSTTSSVDEVDEAVREVSQMLGGLETLGRPQEVDMPSNNSRVKPLLIIDRRCLNADNEMRRIFGARVVRGEQMRRRRGRKTQRQSVLTSPKDTWPQMEKLGLSMILTENVNGCQYFKFLHSPEYQKVQIKFWESVETYNPNAIAAVLHAHPYHVDSLLQLSEVCKMGEDIQMAADLIERAVYHYESIFHPLFNYSSDTCRLRYKHAENRGFFLVIFRHLSYVGRKGCHKTAFELCKLLLSLDPDGDPLCVLLMIDYYAIRCCEYQFIIDLHDRWGVEKNLSQLPNCSFSLSLSLFHQSNSSGATSAADDRLQESLIMYPSMLCLLLDKCGVYVDPSVKSHYYFTSSVKDPPALQLLINLYIERSHSLWKEPEVLTWFERNVKEVMERVSRGDPLVQKYTDMRQRCYAGMPRNIYRHVILSDMESVTTRLPDEVSRQPIMMYDPLPPDDTTRDYTRPHRSRESLEEDDSNPFSLFLRSLLPSFNLQDPPHVQAQRGAELVQDDVGGAVGGDRRIAFEQAIGQLTESMRVLLQHIRDVVDLHEEDEEREMNDDTSDNDID